MKLRYDPLQIFRSSKTPAGLYARQKWLDDASPRWQADFQETVGALWAGQGPDGSWHRSAPATIMHLFGLHLTVRSASPKIETALSWLLAQIDLQPQALRVHWDEPIGSSELTGLPFTPSRSDMFLTGATLFLSTIFGRQEDPAVLGLYRWLCRQAAASRGFWLDAAASHNIFRALVVHPEFAQDAATTRMAERLSELQTEKGDWGPELPFYQTLNALAHLQLPQVEGQLEMAFGRLRKTQNSDGTWGRHEAEWNTFLAVHALRNKGLMQDCRNAADPLILN